VTGVGDTQDATAPTRPFEPEDAATVAETPGSRAAAAISATALRHETILRNRALLRNMLLLLIVGAGLLPFLGGDPLAKLVLMGAFLVTAGAYAAALFITKNAERYDDNLAAVVAHVAALASVGTPYYFGIFSGAPALMAIGLFVYALGAKREHTLGAYLTTGGGHAVLAALIIGGVIEDRGLIRGDYLSLHEQIIMQAYIAGIYGVGYLVARASRWSTRVAVARLEVALREIAQREALFQEARDDLARALRIGGPGRYSELTVGRYRLGVVIGRGGMGEVYAASHVETGEPAAVKLLYRDAVDDPDDFARFVREAKVAAAIESEHVVRLLDAAVEGAERPYLAMERLRGEDLGAILRRDRHLSLEDTVRMAGQVASGLAVAHAAGIVHRDLKPSNLFRAEQQRGDAVWKILDFGVSTLAGRGGTLTGQKVVGTPAYMAPEQARGGKVDIRTDVYALGALVYRVLTGRPPVSGKDVPSILYGVVHGAPTPPSQLVDVPADVDAVLAIAMAKASEERFESADELARALARAARDDLSDELRLRAAALHADRLAAVAG